MASEEFQGEVSSTIDHICRSFESEWLAGNRTPIEDWVKDVPTDSREALIVELVATEVELRVRSGESPGSDEFVSQFPEFATAVSNAFRESVEACQPVRPTSVRERLGGFKIVREIGRGGMGVVYEAIDESLRRRVALKTLLHRFESNSEGRLRFDREARAIARLHHTNIVDVFGNGQRDGVPFLAMRLIDGIGLDDLIRQGRAARDALSATDCAVGSTEAESEGNGPIVDPTRVGDSVANGVKTVAKVVKTFGEGDGPKLPMNLRHGSFNCKPKATAFQRESANEVASGLPLNDRKCREKTVHSRHDAAELRPKLLTSFANHKVNVPHDVHDRCRLAAEIGQQIASALHHAHENGVMHRDVKPSNILLDESGMPWLTDFGLARIDESASVAGLTVEGNVLGTLRYMPPEALNGTGDERGDQYSLGLTLYELITLRPAFDGDKPAALINALETSVPARLSTIEPDVPRDLETIIHKAIDREPATRYMNPGEFADDLQRFLNNEPIAGRRVSAIERLSRWRRSNRALANALLSVAMLVLLIALGATMTASHFASLNQTLNTTNETLNTTVGDLKTRTEELTKARNTATDRANENLRLADEADRATRKAQTTLADMQTERGLAAAENGDPATAALWFANAARQTSHDRHRQANNLLRARNWLDQVHRPIAASRYPELVDPRHIRFEPSDRFMMVVARGGLRLVDTTYLQTLRWSASLRGVIGADWFPDGDRVVIGLKDGTIQLRQVPSGEPVGGLNVDGDLRTIALSRAGHFLACSVTRRSDSSHQVSVWDMRGKPRRIHEWEHPSAVHSMSFDRNGKRLVTATDNDRAYVFALNVTWRASPPGQPIQADVDRAAVEDNPIQAGLNWLLSADSSQAARESLLQAAHLAELVQPPIFLNEGRQLVTVASPKELVWWDVDRSRRIRRDATSLSHPPTRLVGSPVEEAFAVATTKSFAVWTADGSRTLLDHPARVTRMQFSPDGNQLLTASGDRHALLWSLESSPPRRRQTLPLVIPDARFGFSSDGTTIAVCNSSNFHLWQRPAGQVKTTRIKAWSGSRDWHPRLGNDGRWATRGIHHERRAFASDRISIIVVKTATGEPAGPTLRLAGIRDSCICSDGRSVAVGVIALGLRSNPQLRIHDVASGKLRCPPVRLPASPISVAARPHHDEAAVLCNDGTLIVADTRSGAVLHRATHEGWRPPGSSYRATYSPDGQTLVTTAVLRTGGACFVRDANSGQLRFDPVHSDKGGEIRAVKFSADSRLLATSSGNNTALQVWDLENGTAMGPPLRQPSGEVTSIAFSPDARWLVTGSEDGRVRLWDWRQRKLVCPPMQHADQVVDVAFTADGRFVISSTRTGVIAIRGTATGKPVAPPIVMPVIEDQSTCSMTLARNLLAAGGAEYPIFDLSNRLAEPRLSEDTLMAAAELLAAKRLEIGELTSVSLDQWNSRWAQVRQRFGWGLMTIDSLSAAIEREPSPTIRWLIAERAKSEGLLPDLVQLQPNIPQLHMLMAETLREDRKRAATHLTRARELYEHRFNTASNDDPTLPQTARQLAALLLQGTSPERHPLEVVSAESTKGATLTKQDDGAILASGVNLANDTYRVTAKYDLKEIGSICLEILRHPSLPRGGPGRDPHAIFKLSEIRLAIVNAQGKQEDWIPFRKAWANSQHPNEAFVDIAGTIDANDSRVWHTAHVEEISAIFIPAETVTLKRDEELLIELHHVPSGPNNVGHFRLSASANEAAVTVQQIRQFGQEENLQGMISLGIAWAVNRSPDKALEVLRRIPRSTRSSELARLFRQVTSLTRPNAAAGDTELLKWFEDSDTAP